MRGFQGEKGLDDRDAVLATAKHMAGYSAAMAALRATPAPLWAGVLVTIAAQTLGAMRRKRR